MRYLAYNSPFGLSAKRLAEPLGLAAVRMRNVRSPHSIAVSWAAPSAPTQALNGGISVGKFRQLLTWKDAGLSIPQFSQTFKQGWLGRSGGSFGGGDFETPLGRGASYWTKPISGVQAEYRVHLCRLPGKKGGTPGSYRVIRLGYKVNAEPNLNREVEGTQIRSRQFGWHLKYFASSNLRRNLSPDLDLAARWAIATIGWDFGAIDVLLTEDGQYVLLEANSAPSLRDDATRDAYAGAIKEVLGG